MRVSLPDLKQAAKYLSDTIYGNDILDIICAGGELDNRISTGNPGHYISVRSRRSSDRLPSTISYNMSDGMPQLEIRLNQMLKCYTIIVRADEEILGYEHKIPDQDGNIEQWKMVKSADFSGVRGELEYLCGI